MTDSSSKGTSKISLILTVIYLVSSVFAGLIFSGLAVRSRSNGGSGLGWGILSLICIVFFGFLGYSFCHTSSPSHDAFYYYLGIVTLIANSLAFLILFFSFVKKK
jgi:hypothetical protein